MFPPSFYKFNNLLALDKHRPVTVHGRQVHIFKQGRIDDRMHQNIVGAVFVVEYRVHRVRPSSVFVPRQI